MFIAGDSSKQRQNSASSTVNGAADSTSNRAQARKKTRKTSKTMDISHDLDSTEQPADVDPLPEHRPRPTDDDEIRPTQTSLPKSEEEDDDDDSSSRPSSNAAANAHSETAAEPFVTVKNRRRPLKERRPDSHSFGFSSALANDKRRFSSTSQFDNRSSSTRNHLSNATSMISSSAKVESDKISSSEPVSHPHQCESSSEKQPLSPRLSSHSSSSSLSSLLKRPSKPPPVVFLDKSMNVELDDVSFGDIDPTVLNPSADSSVQVTSPPPPPADETFADLTAPKFFRNAHGRPYHQQQQPRPNRGPQFYSGTDIRPQHRTDPHLLLQYNQQRFPNYLQQVAYMNYLRAPYMSSAPQYVLMPANNGTDQDQKTSEQMPSTSFPPIYSTVPTMYPAPVYYANQQPHLFPLPNTYFQPVATPSLTVDTKLEVHRQPSASSDIMSSALKLVYSQERRNALTDRFNLDDLTAYLTSKWTDAVDRYEQGRGLFFFTAGEDSLVNRSSNSVLTGIRLSVCTNIDVNDLF